MSPYGLMPSPNLIGAAVIERTNIAGILQSGNIVPLTNPVRIAEEYAMLDVHSGGRLIAGFMRGIPVPGMAAITTLPSFWEAAISAFHSDLKSASAVDRNAAARTSYC